MNVSPDLPAIYNSPLVLDLAKTVAEWQVANGRIPSEVIELMQALRGKVGLL